MKGFAFVALALAAAWNVAACDSGIGTNQKVPVLTAASSHDPAPAKGNLLSRRRSEFLREHAKQAIHWRAWNDSPLQEAQRLQRPVMLVLGFGACHGCHELARGAFADPELASLINDTFVAVLVDRDERPDIDSVYMSAVRLLTGGAGWPAVVFLDPTGLPFEAYTYGAAGGGQRDLREVVAEVAQNVATGMDVVAARAFEVSERLRIYSQPRPAGDLPEARAVFGPLMLYLAHAFDRTSGGFGDSPRFVQPPVLDFLLRFYRRTSQQATREMVETTLLRVRESPLHDVVEGGFHRYARGPAWENPAYEKPLADNASIARIYLDAMQVTGRTELADAARTTLAFLHDGLGTDAGAMHAALDSEAIGEDGRSCPSCYYAATDDERLRALSSPELRAELKQRRDRLRPPRRHVAILADANGMAVSAFARGAIVLQDDGLRARAVAAAGFILDRHRAPLAGRPGTLSHCVYEDGSACGNGDAYLDDYVFAAAGLLDLFEADPQPRWLLAARELTDEMLARFEHEGTGGFFLTAKDAEPLMFRPKPDYDSALASGNSAGVVLLMRMHAFTDDAKYRDAAARTLRALSHVLGYRPLSAPGLAAGLDAFDDPAKVVVLAAPTAADAAALRNAVAGVYVPNRAIVTITRDSSAAMPQLPVLAGKTVPETGAAAHVCESHVCRPMTSDPETLAAGLRSVVPPRLQ